MEGQVVIGKIMEGQVVPEMSFFVDFRHCSSFFVTSWAVRDPDNFSSVRRTPSRSELTSLVRGVRCRVRFLPKLALTQDCCIDEPRLSDIAFLCVPSIVTVVLHMGLSCCVPFPSIDVRPWSRPLPSYCRFLFGRPRSLTV